MEPPHLSRHYLGQKPILLSRIDFAPPGAPGLDGLSTAHKLFAAGTWSEDAEVFIWLCCRGKKAWS
jgi:hypothetical protein